MDAAEAQFDAFVTTDQNLRYQQNLAGRRLAILVLPFASWPKLQSQLASIVSAIDALKPGDYVELPSRNRWLGAAGIPETSCVPFDFPNDPELVGAGGLPADVLEGHFIPGWVATEATFSKELYNRFISERQGLLLKEIGKLVEAQPVDDEDR